MADAADTEHEFIPGPIALATDDDVELAALDADDGVGRVAASDSAQTPPSRKPTAVFYDAARRRWPVVRNAAIAIGAVSALLMASLLLRVVASPVLPALGLRPGTSAPQPATARVVRPLGGATAAPVARVGAPAAVLASVPSIPVPVAADGPAAARFAFFVNWDEMSLVSLRANIQHLDGLFPEWLHLAGADGQLEEELPKVRDLVLDLRRERRPSLRIMPTIDNWREDGRGGELLAACLRDPAASALVVERLAAYAHDLDGAGICVAFSGIDRGVAPAYLDFLSRLADRLHGEGRQLAISAPADEAGFPYAACASVGDLVVVTLLDEHVAQSGPLASRAWFQEALEARAADVPRGKLIVAIGGCALD